MTNTIYKRKHLSNLYRLLLGCCNSCPILTSLLVVYAWWSPQVCETMIPVHLPSYVWSDDLQKHFFARIIYWQLSLWCMKAIFITGFHSSLYRINLSFATTKKLGIIWKKLNLWIICRKEKQKQPQNIENICFKKSEKFFSNLKKEVLVKVQ